MLHVGGIYISWRAVSILLHTLHASVYVNLQSNVLSDVCQQCEHVVAKHEYTFSVDEEYQVGDTLDYTVRWIGQTLSLVLQEYSMNCLLCGYGEATVSILPEDPRQQRLF